MVGLCLIMGITACTVIWVQLVARWHGATRPGTAGQVILLSFVLSQGPISAGESRKRQLVSLELSTLVRGCSFLQQPQHSSISERRAERGLPQVSAMVAAGFSQEFLG